MIKLADGILIGNSADVEHGDLRCVSGLLNVACDLEGPARRSKAKVETRQVGLIDGPGNSTTAYCAAVLALADLVKRGPVLTYCHTGSRALVVSLMYLNLTLPRWTEPKSSFLCRWSWSRMMDRAVEQDVVVAGIKVHDAHRKAYNLMPWGVIEVML